MANDLIEYLRGDALAYSGCDDISDMVLRVSKAADTIEALQAEKERLQEMVEKRHANPADFRYWEGRYRDEAAENKRLRNSGMGIRPDVFISHLAGQLRKRGYFVPSSVLSMEWQNTTRTLLNQNKETESE